MRDGDKRHQTIHPFADLAAVLSRTAAIKKPKRREKKRKPGRMRKLNFSLKKLCERNRDGAYATQHDRERRLTLIANQLFQLGFKHMDAQSLKGKHAEALIARWKSENLSVGTVKNRMADIRWWAEKIGKANILAKTNDAYGIADRTFVTNISKARELTAEQLARVSDSYSAMSLRLQAAFGLRREESIKIQPVWADRGDRLVLKDTWTKGGRAREIPVVNEQQRQVLTEAKVLTTKGSLIPSDKTYVQQLRRFENQCAKAGIDRVHGHRHAYAQQRYKQLTGWDCPSRGGPKSRQLTKEQKGLDRAARLTVSGELGHTREQITGIYLGR